MCFLTLSHSGLSGALRWVRESALSSVTSPESPKCFRYPELSLSFKINTFEVEFGQPAARGERGGSERMGRQRSRAGGAGKKGVLAGGLPLQKAVFLSKIREQGERCGNSPGAQRGFPGGLGGPNLLTDSGSSSFTR